MQASAPELRQQLLASPVQKLILPAVLSSPGTGAAARLLQAVLHSSAGASRTLTQPLEHGAGVSRCLLYATAAHTVPSLLWLLLYRSCGQQHLAKPLACLHPLHYAARHSPAPSVSEVQPCCRAGGEHAGSDQAAGACPGCAG